MKKIYAFAGRAGSGKNTAAEILEDVIRENDEETNMLQFAFASILKDIANMSLRLSPTEAEDLKRMGGVRIANGLTIRQFYNTLGDVIKSHFGRDVWAKMTLENMKYIDELVGLNTAIVTDLRYPIEQEALEEFSEANEVELVVIKMVNLNYPQRTDNLNPKEHESEFLVDDIKEDYLVEAKSADKIKEKIKEIYNATTDSTNTD
jgi:hypothetical protein